MHKQCVNCPGAVDHSTAECPIAGREQQALGAPSTPELPRYNAPRGTTLSESDKGELVMAADHAAAISVLQYRLEAADEWAAGATAALEKRDAEIAQLRRRLATGELTSVRCQCCQAEHSSDSYDAGFIAGSGMCQVCDAAMPPKDLPAAGSAVEEVEVVAVVRAIGFGRVFEPTHSESIYLHCSAGDQLMTVAQHERIVAALSAQQSAPERVSVPVEVARALLDDGKRTETWAAQDELRALLASHQRGEANG